jgi:hypothetical protein
VSRRDTRDPATTRTGVSALVRSAQLLIGVTAAGGALALGFLLALYLRAHDDPLIQLPPVFWILGLLVWFFAISALRLLSGRGAAAGGGLLSPAGYRLAGATLLVVAALVIPGLVAGEPLRAALLGLAFLATATACFVSATRRSRSD